LIKILPLIFLQLRGCIWWLVNFA